MDRVTGIDLAENLLGTRAQQSETARPGQHQLPSLRSLPASIRRGNKRLTAATNSFSQPLRLSRASDLGQLSRALPLAKAFESC